MKGAGALSRFEREAIARIVAAHRGRAAYEGQLERAVVEEREYSGEGVFVTLAIAEPVDRFPLAINTIGTLLIRHPDLDLPAWANLFVTQDGLLDCLELSLMEPWPGDDLRFFIDPAEEVNILENNPAYGPKKIP